MIALDTNVLVRYLTYDDPVAADAATRLIDRRLTAEEPGFISLPVICEIAWVLGSRYGFPRQRIAAVIASLLEIVQLVVEAPELIQRALANTGAEVADAIIHEIGRANGCARTVTFDRKFARVAGVELPTG